MSLPKDTSFFSRIIEWYKNEKLFFRKAHDGRDLFYPWGYPGESFIIDQKQKHKIEFFVYGYFFFVSLWCISSVLLDKLNIISVATGNYLFLIFLMGLVPIYALSMRIMTKGKEFLTLPKEDRPAKWRFLWVLLITPYQIEGVYLYAHQIPLPFLIFYSLGFVYTLYVFVKILRTRGYYFSC